MSDLISRREAIETFMDEVESYGLMDDEGNIESGAKDRDVIEMLRDLPSVSGWIPCSERLPEKFLDVLITTEVGNVFIGFLGYNGWDPFDALAWMPLPEAFKGGDAE